MTETTTTCDINLAELMSAKDNPVVDRTLLNSEQLNEIEQLAFEHSCVPESYDVSLAKGHLLCAPFSRGIATLLQDGRYWHIPGGLLADPELHTEMIQWLHELSQTRKKTVTLYNVARKVAEKCQQQGFLVNKFGEEPILDLGEITWKGKKFEWVRRQENYCLRAGLKVVEIDDSNQQKQLANCLLSIMEEDLKDRVFDKPLHLLEGEFNPHNLQRRRLFIVKDDSIEGNDDDKVQAFLACTPIQNGTGWAFETYRKRKDSTRGTIPFLFKTVIDQMQAEGIERVSLCLIPGRGVKGDEFEKTDRIISQLLSLWFHRLGLLFNIKGQDQFKSRFRPRYEERFMCIAPRYTVFSFCSFLKVIGTFSPNLTNLARITFLYFTGKLTGLFSRK